MFDRTHDCQLKLYPDVRFPGSFGTTSRSIDFALVPEWQPTSECMARRSGKAPLRFSSPALVIGVQMDDIGNGDLTYDELRNLARVTQPHMEALLVARHQRHAEASSAKPPDVPPCIFGIAFRDLTVFIVAHIAHLDHSKYRSQLLLVDRLSFPPYVPNDREGVLTRLRLIIALLTIKSHTGHLASLWNELNWPPTIFDAEAALVRECTGIVTPSPSDYEDLDALMWGDMLDHIGIASGQEERDINPPPSEIERSKELVNDWLPRVQDVEVLEDISLEHL
ncbi:hypothetical protein B0H17DRAFT_317981 [Mycena rosella]|uniref:Uncharacterized protein n=1 Tax=Mycena rosella TaxID=1033263 RepID=A0AAD7DT23_MYCRO|nr:hypothetical protein B0H17DRAFT_317981 [Mycena rosella]